jgi:hypothetical protein
MTKLEKIKLELQQLLLKHGAVKTDKAVIEYDGEELVVNSNVYTTNEDGERLDVEDGAYITEDGTTITIENGKVVSIVEKEEELVEEQPQEEVVEEEIKEEEKTEMEDTTTAIDELRKEVDELYKLVDSILKKIGETRDEADARFSKLEQMSIAKPASEEFEQIKEKDKSNRFSKFFS